MFHFTPKSKATHSGLPRSATAWFRSGSARRSVRCTSPGAGERLVDEFTAFVETVDRYFPWSQQRVHAQARHLGYRRARPCPGAACRSPSPREAPCSSPSARSSPVLLVAHDARNTRPGLAPASSGRASSRRWRAGASNSTSAENGRPAPALAMVQPANGVLRPFECPTVTAAIGVEQHEGRRIAACAVPHPARPAPASPRPARSSTMPRDLRRSRLPPPRRACRCRWPDAGAHVLGRTQRQVHLGADRPGSSAPAPRAGRRAARAWSMRMREVHCGWARPRRLRPRPSCACPSSSAGSFLNRVSVLATPASSFHRAVHERGEDRAARGDARAVRDAGCRITVLHASPKPLGDGGASTSTPSVHRPPARGA